MNSNATTVETLFEKAEDYCMTTKELFKLNAIDKSAEVVSTLVTRSVIVIVVALFTLILNIGVALWLGELLGKMYYGFFVIAGFYALVTILLYTFRNPWIKDPVSNSVITQLLKEKSA